MIPAIREMVAVALELADFDVLEAENAQRGHEIIVDERPDLVAGLDAAVCDGH